MKTRYLFEGSGAAILILLAYIWPQISPSHIPIYLSVLPITSVTLGILIDLLALSLACTLVFTLISRRDAQNNRTVWSILLAIMVTATFASLAKITETHRFVPKPGILMGTVLGVALLVRYGKPSVYRSGVGAFRFVLMVVGFCNLWMAPQLLVIALHRQQADAVSWRKQDIDPPQGGNRIIWLLFDELSYAQAFESRNPDLDLPSLHQLAQQSFSFSSLTPAGYYTIKVVPSLIIGRQISDLRSTLDGQALIQLTGNSRWQPLDPQQSIFAEAHRSGWTTGVAGWSNPYCRLFSSVLDSCYWFPDQFTPSYLYSHMSSQKSATQNALAPLETSIRRLLQRKAHELNSADFHMRDAEAVLEPAEALIRDEQIRFVFIHLAIPHPPGVYDRQTHQIRNGGSYLDNLALADSYLGKLLETLRSTRSAEKTVLVLCSDHSWRVPLWKNAAWWTKEDEQAAKNGFDSRPVLIVHFPEQQTGTLVTQSMNGLVVHEAISKLLSNNSLTATGFANWISGYESEDAAVIDPSTVHAD
ncbi:MAG TPA: sulfatase-like hydrolase/transferase [Terriglobales bacterium]|nr:sulfatase-like hydrolase/transferase [Terriglobales bacterium]